jgi:hypothetical protein
MVTAARIDDQIYSRTRLLWDDAARLRREMQTVLQQAAEAIRRSKHLVPRRISGGAVNEQLSPAARTRTRILRFLHEHSGKMFCSRCISARLFGGRDIDVPMRHVEAQGVRRHHGRCEACGKPRLVAGVIAN